MTNEISIELRGQRALRKKLRQLAKKSHGRAHEAVTKIVFIMHAEAVGLTSGEYPPASQPGQPRHLRSGDLRLSLFKEVTMHPIVGVFGAATNYAKYLEFGTSKLAARPFLRPAYKKHQPTARQIIKDAFAGLTK